MKLFSFRVYSPFAALFLGLCTITTDCFADPTSEVKKFLFSDCNKAILAAKKISPDERQAIITFLESVISNSTALQQPMLPAPNVAAPFTDEPKIGEIIAINSVERDTAAKRCALKVAPEFFPESFGLLPKLIWAAANKDFSKEIRDQIPEIVAQWSAQIKEAPSKRTVLKEALQAFAKNSHNAAAQNAIIELASEDLEFFFSLLNQQTIESAALLKVLKVIDHSLSQSIEYFKKMSLEGGQTRVLGFSLIKAVQKEKITSDKEWSKKIAALITDFHYQALAEHLNLYQETETQEILVSLLKGASPEEKDHILKLLSKYQNISAATEDQFLRRAGATDSVSNSNVRQMLIAVADRPGIDATAKKKWSKFAANVFNWAVATQEPLSTAILEFLVEYAPELQENFKQAWADKNNDGKKWLRDYLEWRQGIGGATVTKTTTTFLGAFWKKQPPDWMENIAKQKFIETVKALNWQTSKTLLPSLKAILSSKSAKPTERDLALKALYVIDPKKLSKAEAKELLLSGDCSMVGMTDLFVSTGGSVDEYFAAYLGCYQRGLIQRTKVKEFFLNNGLPVEARKKLFMASIDNLLYDRAFRANLLSVAGALQIPLNSIQSTVQGLLKDSDPLVQKEALDALLSQEPAQLHPISNELKDFVNESQNIPENRALAALIYIRANLLTDDNQQPLVEMIQSLLNSPPLAKALIERYKELPSMMYVQALSNRFADVEPSVKVQALESLLDATDPVLLDGVPLEVLSRLKDSKVDKVKDLAELAIVLKTLGQGAESEEMLKHVLYTDSRWKLLESPLRSRIADEVLSRLKAELCPKGRTGCLIIENLNR